jgi:hypothetical protein
MTEAEQEYLSQLASIMDRLDTKWDGRWDSVKSELMGLRIEVARLAGTVETHEKRSTNLERIQASCQQNCMAQIQAAHAVANSAMEVSLSFKKALKTMAWIFGALATALTIAASAAQVLDYLVRTAKP